jgi:hypothetical protein
MGSRIAAAVVAAPAPMTWPTAYGAASQEQRALRAGQNAAEELLMPPSRSCRGDNPYPSSF